MRITDLKQSLHEAGHLYHLQYLISFIFLILDGNKVLQIQNKVGENAKEKLVSFILQ